MEKASTTLRTVSALTFTGRLLLPNSGPGVDRRREISQGSATTEGEFCRSFASN